MTLGLCPAFPQAGGHNAGQVMKAMLQMRKLDIAALQQADAA
jgi:predicted 3-demethylubiquinone-9 3-methyltransferase (glyoxalase superfamily)